MATAEKAAAPVAVKARPVAAARERARHPLASLREEKEEDCYLAERRYGAFERCFRLPEDLLADKIEASFKDRVLSVVLPKSPQARQKQQRKISIEAA
jgi:HSP20 family molecular chaperone IbpA